MDFIVRSFTTTNGPRETVSSAHTDLEKPEETLQALVNTLLARIVTVEDSAWETELLMREMQNPTPIFESIVEDVFRPLFDQLTETLRLLVHSELPDHTLQHLAFSTVGQCLYYRVGAKAIQVLIPDQQRQMHYDIESLSPAHHRSDAGSLQ